MSVISTHELALQDIWQQEARAWLAPQLDVRYGLPDKFETQLKRSLTGSLLAEGKHGEARFFLYRVRIHLGLRLVSPGSGKKKPTADGKVHPLAQIESTWVAEYRTDTNPGGPALEAFARENAGLHVWPYWREYVTSQCARMNLPKVTLPLARATGP